MKTGIIIICYNNEYEIDKDICIKYINDVRDIEFCLVNNNSEDNTFELLKDISETCKNVSVVNINKYKSSRLAIKAGARFMFNEYNLKQIGFITTNTFCKFENLGMLIKFIQDNQLNILKYNEKILNVKETKLTLFQSLFSVMDYLAKNN
ncbi:glycosyltransferase [Flavobacterium sp. Fl-77]|uniref:Glycosyltransferase n=1 Tax=Flavobacterium flavipigmentatum TaxID=2893884 RepID=A0AAJ2SAH7_9FLAO|nr:MULTISPECIES: glycosyltransferase [unclassified Flavobacterium]MDX6183457.1 glycosyltransferase [Flavobacterium sp. Fl-33]MDX6186741.1 glycosyltransferase [Flavobacterium sp. Fl-77]UFH38492.1 glycosyltransferase [Flavobacterium sp. F-70]